jgi:hypothetical protein
VPRTCVQSAKCRQSVLVHSAATAKTMPTQPSGVSNLASQFRSGMLAGRRGPFWMSPARKLALAIDSVSGHDVFRHLRPRNHHSQQHDERRTVSHDSGWADESRRSRTSTPMDSPSYGHTRSFASKSQFGRACTAPLPESPPLRRSRFHTPPNGLTVLQSALLSELPQCAGI